MMPPVEPREGWLHESASGGSRFLNALLGGDGAVTYSAACWAARLAGTRFGALRVRMVDALNSSPGHCQRAHRWHAERRLIA